MREREGLAAPLDHATRRQASGDGVPAGGRRSRACTPGRLRRRGARRALPRHTPDGRDRPGALRPRLGLRVRHGARRQRVQVTLGERGPRARTPPRFPAWRLWHAAAYRGSPGAGGSPPAPQPGRPRMNLFGGIVYHDPARAAEPVLLSSLLPGANSSGEARRIDLSGGMLASVGTGVVSDHSGEGALVADLDLTNLEDLPGMADGVATARCLQRLYAQYGTDFVTRLRGAFAIALWAPAQRRLVLAADRFGVRRMYYAMTDAGVAFGKRLTSPLALPGCSRALDPDAIYAYLNFGTVPAPQSIYRAVRRLAPGQALVWEDGRTTLHRYWDVTYSERSLGRMAAARAVYGQTAEAVRQTLTGLDTKQTGAFLSGGTDSSVVVGLMSRLTDERVQAFSIGFQEAQYNELEYAELAARHFDAAHYTRIVTADEALQCLPDIVSAYDEPFGNNSALPTYLCARHAREAGVRMLLAGDGGDEIFGGNERYRRESILTRYQLIPRALRRGLIEPVVRRFPAEAPGLPGKTRRYVERASL